MTTPNSNNKSTPEPLPDFDYTKPNNLNEQIKLAEQALRQIEAECSAKINYHRGILEAITLIRDKKPIITVINKK